MGLPTRWNIVRFNCFYGNNSAGLMLGVTRNYTSCPSDNRIYSNTFYKNGSITAELAKALYNDTPSRESTCGLGLAHWSGSRGVAGNAIKNNIFHGNPKPYGLYKVTLEAQIVAGNWEEAGDPLFVEEQTPLDPTNPKVPDLRLRPGSPCVDKGVFLTQVASPDGSGTVFQVADAGYFTDGWNIIDGDRIQLEGSVESARVMKADYETNTLTLDRPLAWKRNQGVSLPFAGAAPDVGAYEVIPGPAQAGK
ncbi:MAG: hypothetical protein M5U26_11275 [Planctomycetota bacterium]|nr:hypothetical protein [Planctomycetota bacterium]